MKGRKGRKEEGGMVVVGVRRWKSWGGGPHDSAVTDSPIGAKVVHILVALHVESVAFEALANSSTDDG